MRWGQTEPTLRLQRRLSLGFIPVTYLAVSTWMRLGKRYRIYELDRVRREFEEIASQGEGPFIICANHLTLIDSMLIIWALRPMWRYVRAPRTFPWNLPDKRNFFHSHLRRMLCYMGKCVPVLRGGPREEAQRTFRKISYLLSQGESIMIFPEGGRSRTGRVDTENYAYAVGRILQDSPGARVLCVYLRGRGQEHYGDLPRRGEGFDVSLKAIAPSTRDRGLRGGRDLATQIIEELKNMELAHFEKRGDLSQG